MWDKCNTSMWQQIHVPSLWQVASVEFFELVEQQGSVQLLVDHQVSIDKRSNKVSFWYRYSEKVMKVTYWAHHVYYKVS